MSHVVASAEKHVARAGVFLPPKRTLFATAGPTLWPSMLWPRSIPADAPYPFNEPGAEFCYFARNAIFWVVRELGLEGQEVLFPAYHHGVELGALLAAGARPRFFPVHMGMRVHADEVAACITPRTRAVFLIHYAGFPGPVEDVAELCRWHGLKLIEDCALSLLSRTGTRPLGTFGDAGIFCIWKTLPTPHGGLVVWRDKGRRVLPPPEKAAACRVASATANLFLSNLEVRWGAFGRFLRRSLSSTGSAVFETMNAPKDPLADDTFDPEFVRLGMSTICRWIIGAQHFPEIVARRRRNYLLLAEELGSVAAPFWSELPPGVCPLFYPLLVNADKEELVARLTARGVEGVNLWSQHHSACPKGSFPEVDEMRRRILELPCHQDLAAEAVHRLAVTVRETLAEVS